MTVRRFNYTEQVRIAQADILLSLVGASPPTVSVSLDLSSYKLPDDALIVLEAYADWTQSRFLLGTVAAIRDVITVPLDDFDVAEGIRFRVKVLGTGLAKGLILAEADRLSPVDEDTAPDGKSFVRVRPADTGGELWRLRIDEAGPVLEISQKLDDWKATARSEAFRALVIPSLMRSILREAIPVADPEAQGDWAADAIRVGAALARCSPPVSGDDEALDDWCDLACSRLGADLGANELARHLFDGGDE